MGDVSCKRELLDMATINTCSITFASPKGFPGAVMAENHWLRGMHHFCADMMSIHNVGQLYFVGLS